MQLVIRNGRLAVPGGVPEGLVDVLIEDGRFVAVERAGVRVGDLEQEIDVCGAMLSPPYVEPHVHMDTCLTAGEPRWNESGTLWEGIACWSERKAMLTHDDVVTRVNEVLRWQVANGVLHVRSHVDTTDPSLVALDALIDVRGRVRDVVNLQLVAGAFPSKRRRGRRAVYLFHGCHIRFGGGDHYDRPFAGSAGPVGDPPDPPLPPTGPSSAPTPHCPNSQVATGSMPTVPTLPLSQTGSTSAPTARRTSWACRQSNRAGAIRPLLTPSSHAREAWPAWLHLYERGSERLRNDILQLSCLCAIFCEPRWKPVQRPRRPHRLCQDSKRSESQIWLDQVGKR